MHSDTAVVCRARSLSAVLKLRSGQHIDALRAGTARGPTDFFFEATFTDIYRHLATLTDIPGEDEGWRIRDG